MAQITKSIEIGKLFLTEVSSYFSAQNSELLVDKNPYIFAKYKLNGTVISLYTSGKVVLQGGEGVKQLENALIDRFAGKIKRNDKPGDLNNMRDEFVSQGFDRETSIFNEAKIIGADEAGKGEYFGPLVTAACYLPEGISEDLLESGIKDSKKLSDRKVKELASVIKIKTLWKVNSVNNRKFNELIDKYKNVSEVLAIAHSECLHDLLNDIRYGKQGVANTEIIDQSVFSKETEVKKIIIDKFTKIESRILDKFETSIPIIMEEKGERYLAVACASILAREKYLAEIEIIEKQFGVLPRGYGSHLNLFVAEFIANYGEMDWREIAKVSYKVGG